MPQSTPDDRFIAGYVAAVLEREFSLKSEGLVIIDGNVRYPDRGFGTLERDQLIKSIKAIPGVKSVTLYTSSKAVEASTSQPVKVADNVGQTPQPVAPASDEPLTIYLAPGRLFEPLIADPRWPHFFASYNYYTKDPSTPGSSKEIQHVASIGFGETISIVRKSYANGFRYEAGVQAGVFAIFDIDSDSKDLINADYFGGPYAAFRYNDLSILTRVYRQSSHLGDEYILREAIDGQQRVNLSYEAVDLIVSYELPHGLRVYGGGAYLFGTDPESLEPWAVQYGAEWRAPFTLGGTSGVRPIAAVDLQNREENDWDTDFSLRVGVQFEDPGRFSQRLALMLEFYDGRSPNGQFYTDRIQFLGVGLHFYF